MVPVRTKKIVAVTGGIGSGKSIISRILSIMGYPVYDSDSEAKRLMETSSDILTFLKENFGDKIVYQGRINRSLLAEIVFNDKSQLAKLNKIVHRQVLIDFERWATNQNSNIVFVETALLYQSGLDKKVDIVWDVIAEENLRINRVMKRNNLTKNQVMARIESQHFIPQALHPHVLTIINDDVTPVLPAILIGLDSIRGMMSGQCDME